MKDTKIIIILIILIVISTIIMTSLRTEITLSPEQKQKPVCITSEGNIIQASPSCTHEDALTQKPCGVKLPYTAKCQYK